MIIDEYLSDKASKFVELEPFMIERVIEEYEVWANKLGKA